MSTVFLTAFVGFVCLGYTWYAASAVLNCAARADARLRVRIEKLENKSGVDNE
jgi:hypothetical protein